MQTCTTKPEMRALAAGWRAEGRRVGLVATMGALHDGHMALVARACEAVGPEGRVVTSIFVNPTQFGPNEDFDSYPRDPDRDAAMLGAAGVDALFRPSPEEMYPEGMGSVVEVPGLSRILIGRLRPGHFRGVATVVAKLFHIVAPDVACFGEKDYQQLTLIRQMVRDLDFGIEVIGVPTVRDADGLALSSRNARLTPAARAQAPVLSQALAEAGRLAAGGASVAALRAAIARRLATAPLAEVRSIDLRRAADLGPVSGRPRVPLVALLAVRFGPVLLIDQRVLTPPGAM